jgi:hypothetical protein
MSAKWRRSLAWDDRFFPAWAWPAKALLRAFSSIWLAVILLTAVSIYGILASIPLGLLVQGVQWMNALAPLVIPALFVVAIVRVFTPKFSFALLGIIGVALLWWLVFWPKLNPLAVYGASWRFFDEIAAQYASITIRRLPAVEMTELEFYSAWPLQVILGMFVLNMVTATLRRIEFNFLNLGVLTVHTGIVLIALGSVYYQGLKREGDVLLLAAPTATGELTTGPAATTFYDNTAITLYARQDGEWEQRPLSGVPRYNNYNLSLYPAVPDGQTLESAHDLARRPLLAPNENELSLSIKVPESTLNYVDDDIRMRVVGYSFYAEPESDWVRAEKPLPGSPEPVNPLRIVYLTIADPQNPTPPAGEGARPDVSYIMLPDSPAHRVSESDLIAFEYTRGMDQHRWEALSEPIPGTATHALVVEIPAANERVVLPALVGVTREVAGYRLTVEELLPEPPFPIITDGYRGATSSVAVVRVQPPAAAADGSGGAEAFTRYAYHRFPEIDQDILGETEDGRPNRRDADPSVRITYLDADRLQIYLDEHPQTGRVRAIVRLPNGGVHVENDLPPYAVIEDVFAKFESAAQDPTAPSAPVLSVAVAHRWEHAIQFERPIPVAEQDRDNSFVGTHDKAMMGVEVKAKRPPTDPLDGDWSTIVWLPFTRYLGSEAEKIRSIRLPDGRLLQLAFGRRQHPLPNFALRLENFEMIPYEHGGPPRDFRSIVRILPFNPDMEEFSAEVSLNSPLRAPHKEDTEAPAVVDLLRKLALGFSPNQLKLSQAGWDATTWRQTEATIGQAGSVVERPYVTFTILGVGNNAGIYVIALGGILMGVGIPWAFYVKPWLLKRRRDKLAAQAAGMTNREQSSPQVSENASMIEPTPTQMGTARSARRSETERSSPQAAQASGTLNH